MLSDSEASYSWNSDNRLVKVEKTVDGCKHDQDRKGFGFGHLKHGKETVVYEEYTYLPMDWRRVTRKTGKYSIKTDRKGNAKKDDESEQTFVSIYDGDDESHEYLLTQAKFKLHGKCKPEKESLKLFREFVGGPSTDDINHTRYNRLSLAMLKDGLGSTIALTGRDGKAIAHIGYNAWGNFCYAGKDCKSPCKDDDFEGYLERLENIWSFGRGNHSSWAFGKHFGSKLTPYLYTGRRYSEITNQYFNRNRYYSPALGRFISKDPIGFNGGMNLYRYADNNPMVFVDPWGLFEYIGTNWVFDLAQGKQAKIDDLEAGQSPGIVKWYGKYVIEANGRGYARPKFDVILDVDYSCGKVNDIQTQMGVTIYLPNIKEVAGSSVTDETLLKMIAEHEIGHEMMYRLIGEKIFTALENDLRGKSFQSTNEAECKRLIEARVNQADLEFQSAISKADGKFHSGDLTKPFWKINWSDLKK